MNTIASPGQIRASFLRWALVLVPLVMLLGYVSSQIAQSGPGNLWYDGLAKPEINPPPATFKIVWPLLYLMMGIAAAMIAAARGAPGRGIALAMFAVQLLLNLAWTPLFFGMHQMTSALYLLFALDLAVAGTMFLFWRVRTRAGLLLAPYLAWACFATLLNWQFLDLNPFADGAPTSNVPKRIEL